MATTRNRKKARKNRETQARIKLVRKIRRLEGSTTEILVPADTESGPAAITNYWYGIARQLKSGQLERVVNGGTPLFDVMKEAAERVLMERTLLENKAS